jgi:serine/threonine-protein kinase
MSEREGPAQSQTIGLPHGEMYRGDKIGKYEVLTQLSVGGMAELFLCFTQGPGSSRQYVVVKRILPDVKSNESYIKMFLDEARISSGLHHPNIAQVLDMGGEGEGLYIAMEFIAGQNLNQVSAACSKSKRLIPLGFSVGVCRDVCHALHYAHTLKDAQGRESPIIHRDVAQKNVMVTYDGAVKLLDFGIAKAHGSLGRTTAGMVKGTTGYMSPEQVRGEALDGRSDVFCLGVVLFELLTGKRLFAAETETEEMERILVSPIPRPDALQRKIPPALVDLVMTALSRDRNQRFPNAKAMARALDDVAGRVMYDVEKRASFMRELFAERIAATQKLLRSAETTLNEEEFRAASHTLSEDVGAVFPELHETETDPEYLPDPKPPPGPPVPDRPNAGPTKRVPPPDASDLAKTWPTEEPPPGPPPRASLGEDGRLRPAPRGGGTPRWMVVAIASAVGLALGAGAVAWRMGVAAPVPPAPEGFEVRMGRLSLSTNPPARVIRGGQDLGTTPLEGHPLSVGTHQLELRGEDGTVRRLSVRIEQGQTTQLSVSLSSLPLATPAP